MRVLAAAPPGITLEEIATYLMAAHGGPSVVSTIWHCLDQTRPGLLKKTVDADRQERPGVAAVQVQVRWRGARPERDPDRPVLASGTGASTNGVDDWPEAAWRAQPVGSPLRYPGTSRRAHRTRGIQCG